MPVKEGDNPDASCFSSILPYSKYSPDKAYSSTGDSYFWGKTPAKGDEFCVVFRDPAKLIRVHIDTGHPFQKNDFLRSGVLEVSPTLISTPATSLGRCNCSNFTQIAVFRDGVVDLKSLQLDFPVKCMRIRVTQDQEEWLIVYHIAVNVFKESLLKRTVRSLRSWIK